MILIYTSKQSARLKYTFKLIFERLLGASIEFTGSQDFFMSYDGIKINYSGEDLERGVFFASSPLLFERRINGEEPATIEFDGIKVLFPVYQKTSALPFDPFAASFYLASRYEEYLPYKPDRYGRFTADGSLASKHGFLEKPVINIWAAKIRDIIMQYYPGTEFIKGEYQYVSTIDIDAAWSYKGKSLWRTGGGIARDFLHSDWNALKERIAVRLGRRKDPFDTFDYQLEMKKKLGFRSLYFVLFADYGPLDKNISFRNNRFQILIKSLADYAEVGIHPGFASNKEHWRLPQEVKRLSTVLNREITFSRQHFLKLNFPETYRNLLSLDIRNDYTMGFAAQPGFRAGICSPYPFFDLEHNKETKLMIHPFAFMDGTLKDYLNLDAETAIRKIKQLVDEVRAVNGTFISLWHNDSLSNTGAWAGWRTVYEEMLHYALPNKKQQND